VGFTAAQAAQLTDCSLSQLTSWERLGLVVPPPGRTHPYSFQDLVALRVVASLLDAGIALARIRRAVQYLVESGDDVAALSLVTDGDTVWACRDDSQILDALRHGRLALFVGLDRITADVEAEVRAFDAERQEFVDGLRDGEPEMTRSPPTGEAASGRAGGANVPERSRRRAVPR
jgi:DNA-binding transcriptional MerR regulator